MAEEETSLIKMIESGIIDLRLQIATIPEADLTFPWVYEPFEYEFSGRRKPTSMVGFIVWQISLASMTLSPLFQLLQGYLPFLLLILATYDVGRSLDAEGGVDWGLYEGVFDVTGPLLAFRFYNLFTWNGLLLLIIDYVWYQGFWYLAMFEWITVLINWMVGNIDWFDSDYGYLNWYDPNKGKTPEQIAAEQAAAEEAARQDAEKDNEGDDSQNPPDGEPTEDENPGEDSPSPGGEDGSTEDNQPTDPAPDGTPDGSADNAEDATPNPDPTQPGPETNPGDSDPNPPDASPESSS